MATRTFKMTSGSWGSASPPQRAVLSDDSKVKYSIAAATVAPVGHNCLPLIPQIVLLQTHTCALGVISALQRSPSSAFYPPLGFLSQFIFLLDSIFDRVTSSSNHSPHHFPRLTLCILLNFLWLVFSAAKLTAPTNMLCNLLHLSQLTPSNVIHTTSDRRTVVIVIAPG